MEILYQSFQRKIKASKLQTNEPFYSIIHFQIHKQSNILNWFEVSSRNIQSQTGEFYFHILPQASMRQNQAKI